MRWYERMRYYQPFPAAIPLWKAGYPRVTHPSATKLKESLRKDLPVVPFDLHVLGTPPAFILSQDQTLMLKFFISLRKCFDLNMKEILQVKMDLAFHFYPFTELGCSNSLIAQITLNNSMSSEFPQFRHSWHGLLRYKTAGRLWPQIYRNIFRVAFLSCSHIRL